MEEVVYGIHPILELLKAGKRKLITVYTTKPEPEAWDRVRKILPKYVNIQYVHRDILSRIADTTDHQGIVARSTPFQYRKKMFDPVRQPFLLMLDGVQDVKNLGAILRSAYCTGADGVIISKRGAAPLNAAALKASVGLAERLDIYLASSSKSAILDLKHAGYNIYLAVLNGSKATEVSFKGPMCIVVGNEAQGISGDLLKLGEKITLPQRTEDISYNASVAAGILLFLASTKINKIK